ncbi:helix-turn-helix domain-containing protein [Bradyrhizobium sp. 76]|nr:helix-turn-helix domain-containing protein [Bradyrhizobium sp. 76]
MTRKARLVRFQQLHCGPIYDAKWDGRSTFSVEEAGCEILGLSKCSAYAAANSGVLPTIRVGRRWIVPRHALERMLSG